MKRIATLGAVITAFAIAPALAAGANNVAQVSPRVTTQIAHTQVANTQVANVRRAQTAVSVQRHLVQIKLAQRYAALWPRSR